MNRHTAQGGGGSVIAGVTLLGWESRCVLRHNLSLMRG